MKPPKRIIVGPHVYRVKHDQAVVDRAAVEMKAELLGHCDEKTLTIAVAPGQAMSQEQDTLLHETLHAVFANVGLNDVLEDDMEERIIRPLATCLLQVLWVNPDLLAYLTARENR